MRRFGTIGTIIEADSAALHHALNGMEEAAAAIIAARDLMHAGLSEIVLSAPVDLRDNRFQRYLVATLQNRREERMVVLFLDAANGLLALERVATGSYDGLTFRKRLLVQRALGLGARGIILAHNHPSGDARPSAKDITSTGRLRAVFDQIEVTLIDHLIVARGRVFSMQQGSLL